MESLFELAGRVNESLAKAGLTVSTAESCTGGLISFLLTHHPGSSAYYLGGIVAYSDETKVRFAGVDRALLLSKGAVSEGVARELAEGIRERTGSDIGIGVTGIAGPGGGTAEKPVGLVYVGISHAGGTRVERLEIDGGRARVRDETAERVLDLLLEVSVSKVEV